MILKSLYLDIYRKLIDIIDFITVEVVNEACFGVERKFVAPV